MNTNVSFKDKKQDDRNQNNKPMSDNNTTLAKEIVKQLKAKKLIAEREIDLESEIAKGTIREKDWKLIFELQIGNAEKQAKSET